MLSTTDVQRLLAAHVPADATETMHRGRMLDLLGSPMPFDRKQFEPGHFTASAFALHRDRLLLIWHGKLHRWLQPGGHVDATDETLADAAARELREETGLIATPIGVLDLDIHPIPANPNKDEPAHEHFDVRFLFRADHDRAVAGDDAMDVRWLPLREVTAEQTDESVLRAVRKVREAEG